MELHSKNIVARQRRSELDTVRRGRRHIACRCGADIVAVHEIEMTVLRYVPPQRMRPRLMDLIPAHMRHLETGPSGETRHLAGDDSQPCRAAVLFAAVEQRLHAETDAKERPGTNDFTQGIDQLEAAQFCHAIAQRAEAGQQDAIGAQHRLAIAGNDDPSSVGDMLESLAYGTDVPHSVIDDCDGGHDTIRVRAHPSWTA